MRTLSRIILIFAIIVPVFGQYELNPPLQRQAGDFSSWRAKPDNARASAAGPVQRAHAVVDVAGPLDETRRAALLSAGLELQQWLEGSLYLAAIRQEGRFAAEPSLVGPELGLHSVSAWPAADKVSRWFTGAQAPEWCRGEWRGQPSYDVVVLLHADVPAEAAARAIQAAGWGLLSESPDFHRIHVRVPESQILELAALEEILHVEPVGPPLATKDNALSAALLKAADLQAAPFQLTGRDIRLGIMDGGRVSVHRDLRGRVTNLEVYNFDSDHATHVAGTIAGNGESAPERKGLAPESQLYWGTFAGDVVTKTRTAVTGRELLAVNNSWGAFLTGASCALFGDYIATSRDYDQIVRETGASMVFSMGNDRDGYYCPLLLPRGGFYSTGIPASAKNVISVGAVARNTGASDFSNYGPTRDGRLKPDVVALGVDVQSLGLQDDGAVMSGTSMSAPAVTGSLALLAQRLQQKHAQSKPKPALLKALLLGTAVDLGNAGPDFSYGYGMPDLAEAVRAIDEKQFEVATLSDGEFTKTIAAPGDARALRVTLVWTDPEGPLNSRATLVNDLDLSVRSPGQEKPRLPLTLDPLRPAEPAVEALNRRDNVEQVLFLQPGAGEFTIRVAPHRLASGPQEFALVWSFAPVESPACLTVLSPSGGVFPESGGALPVGVTRPAHCPAAELENPSGWINSNASGPLTGPATLKLTAVPNQGEGTRHTMLRFGGAEMRFRQTGACVPKALPAGGTVEDATGIYDCIYLGDYTKVYSFDAQAGQKVRLRMGNAGFDTWLALRAPNGTLLGQASGWRPSDAMLPSPSSRVSMLTLPATGRYLIYASGLDEAHGPFQLTVESGERDPMETRPDLPALITECPFQVEAVLGERSTDTCRRGDLYQTDSYLFRGYAGQRVEVRVVDAAFDSYLYLISPSGELVAQNDDAPSGGGSTITQTLTQGGEWRIEMTSFSPLIGGRYKLEVNGCSAAAK